MSSRLSGKVCIITGTGGSMGHEAPRAFAREAALVVGCDLNVEAAHATVDMVRAAGGTMVSLQPCHLTKPSECQALVDVAAHVRPNRRLVQQRRHGVCWAVSAGRRKWQTFALFLASDESSYVTGIDIVVDGGMKVW